MAAPARECQLCGRPALVACTACGAVFYCSEAHRRRHAAQLGHDADECGRWAAAAAAERRQELAGHSGLPWAVATHSLPPCSYLSHLGLHCASGSDPAAATAWVRECSCGGPAAAPWGAAAPLPSLWARSSVPEAAPPALAAVSRAELVQQLGGWLGLPAAQAPCLVSSVPPTAAPLASWAAYYRLRGLPPESPAALLLDATLTLYSAALRVHRQLAALQQASSSDAAQQQAGGSSNVIAPSSALDISGSSRGSSELSLEQLPRLLPGGRLVLHLLGPQRELDQWPLLLELGCLLPAQLHIDLHLIGPDVPAAMSGRSLTVRAPAGRPCGTPGCSCAAAWEHVAGAAAVVNEQQQQQQQQQQQPAGAMSLSCWRGAYHEVAPELAQRHGRPHAVVAPNAGLAAYMSWVPTLQLLLEQLQSPGDGGGRSGTGCRQENQSSCSLPAGAGQGPLVCCFTDFNSEAVHRSRQLLDYLLDSQAATNSGGGDAGSGGAAGSGSGDPNSGLNGGGAQPDSGLTAGGLVVQEGLNPFRKPAAVLASDNALPAASNGFALWLERPVTG